MAGEGFMDGVIWDCTNVRLVTSDVDSLYNTERKIYFRATKSVKIL